MKPIDYRNANFATITDRLEGARRNVYAALLAHGPQTTRNLARMAQIDILSVRPRITELIHLGLVELVEEEEPGAENSLRSSDLLRCKSEVPESTPRETGPAQRSKEGTYRALSFEEAEKLFVQRQAEALAEATQLEIPGT